MAKLREQKGVPARVPAQMQAISCSCNVLPSVSMTSVLTNNSVEFARIANTFHRTELAILPEDLCVVQLWLFKCEKRLPIIFLVLCMNQNSSQYLRGYISVW